MRWRVVVAAAIVVVFPAACGDPSPGHVLGVLGIPTEALSDSGTVGIARFLVAADGSVSVKASQSVPVRQLEDSGTGWSLTLNTAKGTLKYAIAAPGTINVVVSGGKLRTHQDRNVPIAIDIPSGRVTTVAVLDSLSQPVSTAARFTLEWGNRFDNMDFDTGLLSGPGPEPTSSGAIGCFLPCSPRQTVPRS
ncbi:hypothetical protein ACFWYW_39550 [Nonomuraea sp. NPDC059023]|uniref:hypothetical protein n=1 Tax=unclassified Nonomuraea TaxID=2593643 RepID=UPI003689AF6D